MAKNKEKLNLSSGLKAGGKSLSELIYSKDKTGAAPQEPQAPAGQEQGGGISEQDYLDAHDVLLPYSTILRADLYLKAKRVEYWDRTSLREILETALEQYLKDKASTQTPLPEKERKKLKALKRPWDYRKEGADKRKGGK
ncbi:hypothetical protein ACXYMU_19120 [Pontibacter sp. CAU 1760]